MSRHYIPVAAKRDVLRRYRWLRRWNSPREAIELIMNQYACDYTVRAGNGDKLGKAQHHLDRYRAAHFYLERLYDKGRLYDKPWYWSMRPGGAR